MTTLIPLSCIIAHHVFEEQQNIYNAILENVFSPGDTMQDLSEKEILISRFNSGGLYLTEAANKLETIYMWLCLVNESIVTLCFLLGAFKDADFLMTKISLSALTSPLGPMQPPRGRWSHFKDALRATGALQPRWDHVRDECCHLLVT